jgi:hypothetical protein
LYVARFEGKHCVTEWQMRVKDGELPLCECNGTSGTGLPCSHLIALFDQAGEHAFPVQLIAPRWVPDHSQMRIPPLPELTLAQADKVQRILSQVSSGDEDDTPPPPPDWFDDSDRPEFPHQSDPIVAATDTQTRRYRRLMTIAKEVVQRASVNTERYDGIVKDMEDMRDSLTVTEHGEIRDASGTPKGRRSGKGHSQPGPIGPTHCALCDREDHNLPDCPFHPTFRKAQAAFAPTPGGKMLCRLCGYRGHRTTNCPVVRMAREMLRESNGKRSDAASSDSDAASSDSEPDSSDSEPDSSDSDRTSPQSDSESELV